MPLQKAAAFLFSFHIIMHIPVSTSQVVVGAVIGVGLTKGVRAVHFSVLKNIALAWVGSPTIAGGMTYLVAVSLNSYFG